MPTGTTSYVDSRPPMADITRHELSASQRMVPQCSAVLAAHGFNMDPRWRILDLGCGTGRHVHEFQEAGFHAVGVEQPSPAMVAHQRDTPDAAIFLSSAETGEFPFDTGTFDFCFSTSVFEHVQDYESALREVRRVLKSGAPTVHIFPARWRPVEPHIYVPFGGSFHPYPLLRLWAELGIRNEFQRGLHAREVAQRNREFCTTGINYLTTKEIKTHFGRYFDNVLWVERDLIDCTRRVSRVSSLMSQVSWLPGTGALYRSFHTKALLAK